MFNAKNAYSLEEMFPLMWNAPTMTAPFGTPANKHATTSGKENSLY